MAYTARQGMAVYDILSELNRHTTLPVNPETLLKTPIAEVVNIGKGIANNTALWTKLPNGEKERLKLLRITTNGL